MGLTPIEYRPWKGNRTEHAKRFLVIAESIFRRSIASKWYLGVLILGVFLTYALPIVFFSITPHDTLEADVMAAQMTGMLFFMFLLILAALVCSDLIAEDKRSNSLILYLSRALSTEGYFAGKTIGAIVSLSVFALLPSLILGVTLMATQSGSDYLSSLGVLGMTFVAGVWTTVFLVPLGLLVSSLTEKKTYAAVASFMVIFVLGIVGEIFSEEDVNWTLLGPQSVLYHSTNAIFGQDLPTDMSVPLLALASLAFTVIPMALTYLLLQRRE